MNFSIPEGSVKGLYRFLIKTKCKLPSEGKILRKIKLWILPCKEGSYSFLCVSWKSFIQNKPFVNSNMIYTYINTVLDLAEYSSPPRSLPWLSHLQWPVPGQPLAASTSDFHERTLDHAHSKVYLSATVFSLIGSYCMSAQIFGGGGGFYGYLTVPNDAWQWGKNK